MAKKLSAVQVDAIKKAMRIFLEDDIARGVPLEETMYCPGCLNTRAVAGAITYDHLAICNDCSTEYELARATGRAQDLFDFLADIHVSGRIGRRPFQFVGSLGRMYNSSEGG